MTSIEESKNSEEKYRLIIENANDLIGILNRNFTFEFVNEQATFNTLGYKSEEVIGKYVLDFLHPSDKDKGLKSLLKGLHEKEGINEVRSRHKNGTYVWLEVKGKVFVDKDGENKGILIGRDISSRKEAELKLKESEEKFKTYFKGGLIATYAWQKVDNDFILIDYNDAAEDMTKGGVKNFLGFKASEMYKDRPQILEELRRCADEKTNIVHEMIYKMETSKEEKYLLVKYVFLPPDLILVNTEDITEQKLSIIKLNESEHRLQERIKELNFLFGISKIAEKENLSSNEFIKETVNLIPSAMQFPDLTTARIRFNGNEFKSDNFEITTWKLATQIEINRKPLKIEIFYLEDNPFLPEEKNLINEIGKRLKDILEKKESEQKRMIAQVELEKSFDRLKELENIINRSPGVLFLWQNSKGWPVEFVSENVKQFGYTQEDFYSGKVIYEEIVHPDDLERVAEEINIYSNENINEFVQEYRIITKSGEVTWLDNRTWIRRDFEGNITHFQGIVIDITDRKNAEEALKLSERNYKEAYNRANFYKDLFTHDTNNILQIIYSSAELIYFQLGDSEQSKYIENMLTLIKNQVKRGSKLISNVRALSEIEEEEITTNHIEITAFLKNSIDFVKKAYSEKQINISCDSFEDKIFTNANELLQDVFENILINGIKYNENPTVEISIKISKQKIDLKNYVKIEFIDNGIGVADNRKEVIFKRGHREFKGSKGMGLGLSLVSKILNTCDGKIWIEDKLRGDYTKGSNFVILLPELNQLD